MTRVLGLDIGIGSCGWAVVETEEVDGETGEVKDFTIVACGARCFDIHEEPKTKALKNVKRRMFRGQRRVTRRRRQRQQAVRKLLVAHGLSADPGAMPTGTATCLTWNLRAMGLDRILSAGEWARVLIHIAKHRGFKSNSKRDRDNRSDAGKMLKAMAETGAKLAGYRTFVEMLVQHADVACRKRNRKDDYAMTPERD